jgi:hypothetical protein
MRITLIIERYGNRAIARQKTRGQPLYTDSRTHERRPDVGQRDGHHLYVQTLRYQFRAEDDAMPLILELHERIGEGQSDGRRSNAHCRPA